jgi:hypothetical protein
MFFSRRGLALASLGGPIYAVGGLDDTTCFSTVERYDCTTDSWTFVASMLTPRGGVGLTALKVCLIIIIIIIVIIIIITIITIIIIIIVIAAAIVIIIIIIFIIIIIIITIICSPSILSISWQHSGQYSHLGTVVQL